MARNITKNTIRLRGNTAPNSVREKTFQDGNTSTSFYLVTHTKNFRLDEDGSVVEDNPTPQFHRIVFRGRQGLTELLMKESLVLEVEGELRYRTYSKLLKHEDENGVMVDMKDINGKPIVVPTMIAEIHVNKYIGDIEILPCVNRRDNDAPQTRTRRNTNRVNNPPREEYGMMDDDLGPALPSEASGMDNVPF